MDRIAALNEILTENPKDAFARYGLAMEYSKQGDFDRALAEFSILLENHADYTAGYFMAAQTLVRAERVARATLRGYLKGKREVIVPWPMHLPVKIYQLLPGVVEWAMGRMAG